MKRLLSLIVVCLIGSIGLSQNLQRGKFYIELLPGGAVALPSPLRIDQEGEPEISLMARYQTQPFHLPIYYSYRIGCFLDAGSGLEIEFNHLKINLHNLPEEVQWFSISHGYNQFWISYIKKLKGFNLKTGIGPVLAHPENCVRGKELPGHLGLWGKGYYVNGLTAQFAVQKQFWFGQHFFLSAESKLNLAYARVAVANGHAHVPVCALHGLLGVGYAFTIE